MPVINIRQSTVETTDHRTFTGRTFKYLHVEANWCTIKHNIQWRDPKKLVKLFYCIPITKGVGAHPILLSTKTYGPTLAPNMYSTRKKLHCYENVNDVYITLFSAKIVYKKKFWRHLLNVVKGAPVKAYISRAIIRKNWHMNTNDKESANLSMMECSQTTHTIITWRSGTTIVYL